MRADLTLWDRAWGRRPSLQERFDQWLATPDGQAAYENVLLRAQRLRARGWQHFGIAALWEAARYDRALEIGPDADGFKLNNDFRSRLARLMMQEHPDLAEFFETRELRA
jgi:hypothetical protein